MPLRVLIVDDHELMRMGVRTLCSTRDDWQVCGEAVDGPSALARALQLVPDLVILDLSLPGMNGFEVAREIRRIAPSTRIILFNLHEVPVTAKEVGADAFVSKSSDASELIKAIDRLTTSSPQIA